MNYTKLDQRLHVLKRSDTYVGSKSTEQTPMYVVTDLDTFKVQKKNVGLNPAFIKLFDEILVNASDQAIRTNSVNYIKVKIEDDKISVENDGESISVRYWYENMLSFLSIKKMDIDKANIIIEYDYDEHYTEETAIIELNKIKLKSNVVFNKFDNDIYSLVKINNDSTKRILILTLNKNISIKTTDITSDTYIGYYDTRIYNPELIFGYLLTGENYDDNQDKIVGGRNGLGAKLANIFSTKFMVECCDGKLKYKQTFKDNMSVIGKPTITDCSDKSYTKITFYPDYSKFDMKGITEDLKQIMFKRCLDVAVYNPTVRVSVNSKTVPVKSIRDWMRLHIREDAEFFYETLGNGWEVGITSTIDGGFEQVSVVNGISTHRGGTHINYIALNVSKDILEKLPKAIKTTWNDIKNRLFIFAVCKIPNPVFDTQTKESLSNTMSKTLTGDNKVSDKIIKKILKSDIIDNLLQEIKIKEQIELNKLSGSKTKKVKVNKLIDANKAGTMESSKCSLYLAEGDSASSMAIAGFSVVGRDYYGVYPLKGKPLNVRNTDMKKIRDNDEVIGIVTALGLEFGKKYTSLSDLRYGKCVIFSDADNDGIHIKGLIINMFHYFFPELLKMDFLFEFVTPILKAKKGKEVISFYTQKDYEKWLTKNPLGYNIKYYKGLGTSNPSEAKEYFKDINNHLLKFDWDKEQNSSLIEMAFSDKKIEDRKEWLLKDLPKLVDKYGTPTPISSFINNELKTFSISDNARSIPELLDGLKPSQRKVIYGTLKRNLIETNEITVAALGGYVKEVSKYHHGEKSIEDTIIGMAQNFVGSNNLPLLFPSGAYGTRLQGGKDAASSRYLNVYMQEYTRMVFMKEDNDILDFLEEDGHQIEPATYAPIIPMVLINGADGIGTGWSTNVPKYNTKDVVKNIIDRLNDKKPKKLVPYYEGFNGKIESDTNNDGKERYITYGNYEWINNSRLLISELPIGTWTNDYKAYLDRMVDDKEIKDYIDQGTDNSVHIEISMSREIANKYINDNSLLIKTFKLSSNINISNMNLFNNNRIVKYDKPEDIILDYIKIRLDLYNKRKTSILEKYNSEISRYTNQYNFIMAVISGEIIVNNRAKDAIEKDLVKARYDKIDDSYNYLLSLPIYNLTKEKVIELKAKIRDINTEAKLLKSKSNKDLWMEDLNTLCTKLKIKI